MIPLLRTAPTMPNPPGAGSLFAANNLFLSTEFLVTVGLLISVLLLGAVIIHYLDKWRNKQLADDDESPLTLSNYRKLYEQGELSEAEYIKVRDRIAAKMKQNSPVGVKLPEVKAEAGEPPKPPDPKTE
jgi:uncharacterized membrane protein